MLALVPMGDTVGRGCDYTSAVAEKCEVIGQENWHATRRDTKKKHGLQCREVLRQGWAGSTIPELIARQLLAAGSRSSRPLESGASWLLQLLQVRPWQDPRPKAQALLLAVIVILGVSSRKEGQV